MAFSLRWLLVLGITLSPAPQFLPSAAAQGPLAGHSPPPISGLRLLTRNSGYIFDGTVLSVERVAEADPSSLGAVQITFRVERAIRGVRNGQVLTIREWTGLGIPASVTALGNVSCCFFTALASWASPAPLGGHWGASRWTRAETLFSTTLDWRLLLLIKLRPLKLRLTRLRGRS